MRYDTLLKELLLGSPERLLELLLGKAVTIRRPLVTELPHVGNMRPDGLWELDDGEIIHAEWMMHKHRDYARQMLRYRMDIYDVYGQVPTQLGIWLGKGKVGIPDELIEPGLHFQYTVVDLKTLDTEFLVGSERVNENIFALLGRLKDMNVAVKKVFRLLAGREGQEQKDAMAKLAIIFKMRDVDLAGDLEARPMPVTSEQVERLLAQSEFVKNIVRRETKKVERGIEKAREEGVERGREEAARLMLARLVVQKFKTLPPRFARKLDAADLASIESWTMKVMDAKTVSAVFR